MADAINADNIGIARFAQPRGILRHHIEHWLNVRRRAGDDAQNFTCRCLLFQRFGELLEQPDILDRDHGLVGEGFEELDLFIAKRLHLRAADINNTDRISLSQQRGRKHGTKDLITTPCSREISYRCLVVGDVNGFTVEKRTAGHPFSS